MTTRAAVTINSQADRDQIARWAMNVSEGTIVEFRKKTRSHEQSAKMWAMLHEVSEQVEWYGAKLDADDWKDVFTASLRHARVVPGIDKGTFVPLGMRTSNMTIEEMSNLIELIYEFGARHGVIFNEPRDTHSGAADLPPADRAPASDELSPGSSEQDGGDVPLSSPSDLFEPDGLANPSVDGDGAVSPDPNAPSSSPLSMVDRSLLIECCAKFMDLTVRSDLTPQERRGALEKAKEAWKAELRPELHPKLASMFLSADAIIRGKADRAKAITEFSYWLECEPEEIGG